MPFTHRRLWRRWRRRLLALGVVRSARIADPNTNARRGLGRRPKLDVREPHSEVGIISLSWRTQDRMCRRVVRRARLGDLRATPPERIGSVLTGPLASPFFARDPIRRPNIATAE